VRELEEQARRSLAEIEGSGDELANTLFKLGWRSAKDVADGKIEELGGVPGVGGEVGAAKLKEAAARQVEVEKQRRAEAERRAAEQAAKSDEQKLLEVRGIGENTLPGLYQGGYTSVQKINAEADLDRLATSSGIGIKKARQLKHWVKVYLGEIDPATPEPPDLDEPEPAAPAAVDQGWTEGA